MTIKNISFQRKGYSFMMYAIIAIASIIILSIFGYKVYSDNRGNMDVKSCRNSIAAHDLVASASVRQEFTDIKCPTKDLTIKTTDNAKIKRTIAEDMHRCWYIWGQGKGTYFEGEGTFCHVCATYTFEKKGQKVVGFGKYLGTQEIITQYPGDNPGLSYQDYFQGYKSPNSAGLAEVESTYDEKNDVMDTTDTYATIFVYASGKSAIDQSLESGGRAKALSGGGLSILMGIAAGGYGTTVAIGTIAAIATGTATVATANIWNPVGWVLFAGLAIGAGIYAIHAATTVENPQVVSYIAFRPYDSENLQSLGCQRFDVNQVSNSVK